MQICVYGSLLECDLVIQCKVNEKIKFTYNLSSHYRSKIVKMPGVYATEFPKLNIIELASFLDCLSGNSSLCFLSL